MFDRILVLGAGHIGHAIAALLHDAGDRVSSPMSMARRHGGSLQP